ncbi:MAG: hypothetical protein ACKPBG_00170, partial [Actinomycetota bacterium]
MHAGAAEFVVVDLDAGEFGDHGRSGHEGVSRLGHDHVDVVATPTADAIYIAVILSIARQTHCTAQLIHIYIYIMRTLD